jgi:putative Mn2+ efflux pump MntP
MNVSATILLAFGMSMDAFAASIGKGATSINLNFLKPCARV